MTIDEKMLAILTMIDEVATGKTGGGTFTRGDRLHTLVRAVLNEHEAETQPIKIKRFLSLGEVTPNDPQSQNNGIETSEQLIGLCGALLDANCTADILGDVIFEDEAGKFYAANVEIEISEIEKSHAENFDSELEKE